MNYIGIDYGRKNIGLSWASKALGVAVPLSPILHFQTLQQVFQTLQQVVSEKGCDGFVLGLPLHMDGSIGSRAREVQSFGCQLQAALNLPVFFQDERLSTQTVEFISGYQASSLKKAKQKKKRGIIDSQAAMVILQDFLDQQTEFLAS